MPFGARETLEAHEMLQELKIGIEHLAYYARHCEDQRLRELLERHTEQMIGSYDRLRGYTNDYNAANDSPQQMNWSNAQPQDIRYGLHNPSEIPLQESGLGGYPWEQLLNYALAIHKNMAKNAIAGALECADPNVRNIMLNIARDCANESYELFLVLNAEGIYQVPTMHEQTAKTYLHPFRHSDGFGQTERAMNVMPANQPLAHREQDHSHDRQQH